MINMCKRYCLYADDNQEIREILDRTEGEFKTGEIFPTDKAPVLIQQSGFIKPEVVTWGYPGFKGKGVIINARAETVLEKNTFRRSMETKRCVIPSSGFFEWSHDGKKIKYQFNLQKTSVLYMAGLYEDYGGERRFVILTTEANESMIEVHNRMPVVLPDNESKYWLEDYNAAAYILQEHHSSLTKQLVRV